MGLTVKGNFSADGDSVTFVAKKFVIHLGTDTNENFGGGTVSIKSKADAQLDWTTDATTYTDTDIIKQTPDLLGAQFKLTLTGATSPNLDYSITYE